LTRRLTFRPKAEADLAETWEFTVARWSVAQAERYLTGLNEALALLCAHPEIARLYDFTAPMRLFPYRSHLVIFTSDELTLDVIRVPHMRSDWQVVLVD
jgi:toxin ParE1/3/4